ncbi:protein phosphatase 1H-like [Dreissena polymorpha]|uniref:PPM-type phosphatase domain-containing protein n=1 Tax=Dreissena polymorpha TaxID=45954 RepID=A0A9D4JQE2_DREPO|nr:protein phosphatase 1H-like [Dreissena polymorpha]XP_052214067.1 protein phosphatase 1H-like [Dreissena polymorpha]KAH3816127.1 hypothetical protein DPMN_117636 [Dreissena polymorpha]
MLARFKDAAMSAIAKRSVAEKMLADTQEESARNNFISGLASGPPKPEKFPYGRPYFLSLDKEEVQSAIDFGTRPIIIPRKVYDMPLVSGYAECLNGGKSSCNEDNSYACEMHIKPKSSQNGKTLTRSKTVMQPMQEIAKMAPCIEAVYFGMFDGHAGYQTSLIVSRQLHSILQDLLSECVDRLVAMRASAGKETLETEPITLGFSRVTDDDLIVGALEEAFQLMDQRLKKDGEKFNVRGGCTAIVALFVNGKLYVANAGDSRAVLLHGTTVKQVSTDFTPEKEKQRIHLKGFTNPELLHNEFCSLEFQRRVAKSDIGSRMLCRVPGTTGWKFKTIDEDDTKFPLVIGHGKNARIMGTIGVSRGLGDHDLYIYESDISIKPFLSCVPEVKVIDLREEKYDQTDVLIMATDGLWDVVTNARAAEIVRNELQKSKELHENGQNGPQKIKDLEKTKYIIAAQRLVMEARGTFTGQGWKKSSGENASFDDISTFVIPLKKYQDIWRNKCAFENSIEAALRS